MPASILVVDDEKPIMEAVSLLLHETGYEVVGLIDSAEALESIQSRDFDLVLTDLRMPGATGMDISRAVRAKNSDTQVIILTGYATVDSAIESLNLDVYAYLNKPFELKELAQVVDRALTAQSLKRENEKLQASISKMLEEVSTLYQVTRFLYDTDDWDISMEFILDTLSIGLGLDHSCLLLGSGEGGYELAKANLPAGSGLAEGAAMSDWSALEGVVSADEPSLVQRGEGAAENWPQLWGGEAPPEAILFTPIRYRKRLLGYLLVFHMEGREALSEDKRKLLEILATQIAPQIFLAREDSARWEPAKLAWYAGAELILRQRADELEASKPPLAVSLLRPVTTRAMAAADELASYHNQCAAMLRNHDPDGELYWIGADTALALFPGSNQVQAEITCMAMGEDFRQAELAHTAHKGVAEMYHASASWGQNGDDLAAFLTMLWAQLAGRIQAAALEDRAEKSRDD